MSVKSNTTYYNLVKFRRGHSVRDIDLGNNMDIIDTALHSMLKRVSSTTVAFNAVAKTTLYTVPTGKIFIPVFATIRITADASTTAVTFGRSTALTDWLGTQTLTSLDADGDYGLVMPAISATPGVLKTYVADVVFQISVTTGTGGATNYVDLFGYVIDAA